MATHQLHHPYLITVVPLVLTPSLPSPPLLSPSPPFPSFPPSQMEAGRYYVAITLKEAESLRAALHIANEASPGWLKQGAGIALRTTKGLLDESTGFARPGSYQLDTARLCYQFVDCKMSFEESELNMLLRALQGSPCAARLAFFNDVRACRRRPQIGWEEVRNKEEEWCDVERSGVMRSEVIKSVPI